MRDIEWVDSGPKEVIIPHHIESETEYVVFGLFHTEPEGRFKGAKPIIIRRADPPMGHKLKGDTRGKKMRLNGNAEGFVLWDYGMPTEGCSDTRGHEFAPIFDGERTISDYIAD